LIRNKGNYDYKLIVIIIKKITQTNNIPGGNLYSLSTFPLLYSILYFDVLAIRIDDDVVVDDSK
jgi:hypothetical protein